MIDAVAIRVTEPSQVGEARRAAAEMARRLGLGESAGGTAALVVTEAATNLVKHAGGGELLLHPIDGGLEVLALDKGPGMANPARCLSDGFSTAGTPGTGLGAIVRQSDLVDLYSRPSQGTALLSRLGPPRDVGAVCVPRPGESACGDCWEVVRGDARTVLMVADGLGHGPDAAAASRAAARLVRENAGLAPAALLQVIHRGLAGTRGAAVAVAEATAGSLRYAGVGNISATILSGSGSQSLVSHNGTVGHEARKFHEFTYPLPAGGLIVMHSDGVSARWSLDAYPGLYGRDLALIAGVLYRDFKRGRDDASVLVARAPGGVK